MIWNLAFDAMVLLVLWFSAVMDIRRRVVYEPLIISAAVLSLVWHWDLVRCAMTILAFLVAYLVVRLGKLGLGDAEALALITAAFGGLGAVFVVVIAAVFALAYSLLRMAVKKTRRAAFPMVPFLALGTTLSFVTALVFTVHR